MEATSNDLLQLAEMRYFDWRDDDRALARHNDESQLRDFLARKWLLCFHSSL